MSEPTHFALALAAFMMFFATIGPVDCAIIFATLTSKQSRTSQSRMALKSCAIAGAQTAASMRPCNTALSTGSDV